MRRPYSFAAQLSLGQRIERQLDSHFAERFEISEATPQEQRQGIDRHFVSRATGRRYAVEYKADFAAGRTGNAFLETVSVSTTHKPGWVFSSQADWLVYFVVDQALLYILRIIRLREAMEAWRREYPERKAPNEGYETTGLLVPLEALADVAQATEEYQPH